jgi:predicted acylesterase/phospholipase RssA
VQSGTSTFFADCVCVFQGGGVRAVIYAGAFRATRERQISFVEVAGTSAGSIAAALIAADANPDQLQAMLSGMDWKGFLAKPSGRARLGIQHLTRALQKRAPAVGRMSPFLTNGGAYSGAGLQQWVRERLQELLNIRTEPTFGDLPIPLTVVATDLETSRPTVWSSKTTPNESVALAVQASCSIPVFFQPAQGRYVDGGIISNLPTFVFADRSPETSPRVLAFSLESDTRRRSETPLGLLGSVANALIEGSVRLQLDLQRNVNLIKLPTRQVQATDFHKMTPEVTSSLVEDGYRVTREWLDSEATNARGGFDPRARELRNPHHTNLAIATATRQCHSSMVVCSDDSKFVYELFPALLSHRMRGLPLSIALPPSDSHGETYRRLLLRRMGAEVAESMEARGVNAYLWDDTDTPSAKAVHIRSIENYGSHALFLSAQSGDELLIALLARRIRPLLTGVSDPSPPPRLIPAPHERVSSDLKRVSFYAPVEVMISVEEVALDSIWSWARHVPAYKWEQVRALHDAYARSELESFIPALVEFPDRGDSLVVPPVLELRSSNSFNVVNGTSRLLFALRVGRLSVPCAIVRHVSEAPPARDPVPLRSVFVSLGDSEWGSRYEGYNYSLLRKTESAAHRLETLQPPNQPGE